jgi:CSLREA domain-containing protein
VKLPLILKPWYALAVLAALVSPAPTAAPRTQASATTIAVTTTDDELNADGDCALREAIRAANLDTAVDACPAGSGADTITLSVGTYTLGIPGVDENEGQTGDLDIGADLTIAGIRPDVTIIDGNDLDRVLEILHLVNVQISNVTIRNGEITIPYAGAGIFNFGTLALNRVAVSGNHALGMGGGIFNLGALALDDTAITENSTDLDAEADNDVWGDGAGIWNGPQATLTITGSIISGNFASSIYAAAGGISNTGSMTITGSIINGNSAYYSGAIENVGTLTITDSNIAGNHAAYTGGIGNSGTLTITTSTISGSQAFGDEEEAETGAGAIHNTSGTLAMVNSTISGNATNGTGGGIWNENGQVTLNNLTIANNSAGSGGGIANTGALTFTNTIVAANIGGSAPDCSGTLTSGGHNLVQQLEGCAIAGNRAGNLLQVAPLLGPLVDNGGPTRTHALAPGSPALDAGSRAVPGSGGSACAPTDQRGFSRPSDGDGNDKATCDIGAFEAQALLRNGGFGIDADGNQLPDSWTSDPHFTRTNSTRYNGSYAGRHRAGDDASYSVSQTISTGIGARRMYYFAGRVKIPNTSDNFTFTLEARWYDADDGLIRADIIKIYSRPTGGAWDLATATLTAPPGATSAQIHMVVNSLHATIYVDGFMFQS